MPYQPSLMNAFTSNVTSAKVKMLHLRLYRKCCIPLSRTLYPQYIFSGVEEQELLYVSFLPFMLMVEKYFLCSSQNNSEYPLSTLYHNFASEKSRRLIVITEKSVQIFKKICLTYAPVIFEGTPLGGSSSNKEAKNVLSLPFGSRRRHEKNC